MNKLQTNPPVITLRQMHSAYIQFEGQSYPVASAPTSIFKQAVQAAHPKEFGNGAMGRLLEQESLDVIDRWFIVCELGKLRTPLKLIEKATAF